MKSFPYQARKSVKKETIMTRICTCHWDFKPINKSHRVIVALVFLK